MIVYPEYSEKIKRGCRVAMATRHPQFLSIKRGTHLLSELVSEHQ